MATERRHRLVGPLIAIRTFRTDDGELNLEKQRRHLRWLIDQGINEGNGVILGAAGGGEGYFMDEDEWKTIVNLTVEECKGRVPCTAGVFELSARAAARKTAYCKDIGFDFVQIAPPHYMAPKEDEVYHHFKAVNDAADIGIVCYNTPWAMPSPPFNYTPSLLERFLNDLENVEGVKWFNFDFINWVQVTRLFADELTFINAHPIYPLSLPMKLGMKGFFHSDGNLAPRLSLHMWDLWQKKKYEEFDDLILKIYIDPVLEKKPYRVLEPWNSMGEGPLARSTMEILGCKVGPSFEAQQDVTEEYIRVHTEHYKRSGLMDWVDWKD